MSTLHLRTRRLLLGDDDSWGATFATGPVAIAGLGLLALLMHALDLASGVRMMLTYGIQLEQNPLARLIMTDFGPLGLTVAKFGIDGVGVLLLVRTAQVGRPRLARNCLLLAATIGLLGFTSNLVG